MDFKALKNKIFKGNTKKTLMNLVVIILIGILLILIGDITSNLNGKKNKKEDTTIDVSSNAPTIQSSSAYEERIKNELIDTLSIMSGVGRVKVMIYFESGSESILAANKTDSTKKVEEKDNQGGTRTTTEDSKVINVVIVNEGSANRPYVVKQVNPSIGGVMVVAEGANNLEIKERIHTAVKTVLGIPAYKVSVMPMKKE